MLSVRASVWGAGKAWRRGERGRVEERLGFGDREVGGVGYLKFVLIGSVGCRGLEARHDIGSLALKNVL